MSVVCLHTPLATVATDGEALSKNQIIGIGVSIWISLCLILTIWIRHRKRHVLSKVFWSLICLVPLLGWVAFFGFFQIAPQSGQDGFIDTPPGDDSTAHL